MKEMKTPTLMKSGVSMHKNIDSMVHMQMKAIEKEPFTYNPYYRRQPAFV
jgi:hypothetical protein